MKTPELNYFLNQLEELNLHQYRKLKSAIKIKDSKKSVSATLETNYEKVKCPHCSCKEIQRWGKKSDMQRYRCKSCRKTFNSLTNTPLARLRRKGHWAEYSRCMKEGFSLRKSGAICGIHYTTAFRWRHRFLENAKYVNPEQMAGIVEAEETYFRKSEKGSKKLKRKARKRGKKINSWILSKEKVCVFISRDRNKNTINKIFERFNAKFLSQGFNSIISKDSLLCSDNKPVYRRYTKDNSVRHGYINLSKGEKVKKDIVHIKNVNSYHYRLREWIKRFKGVATKYLLNYLSWFKQLDEFNMEIDSKTILLRAKNIGKYKYQYLTVT